VSAPAPPSIVSAESLRASMTSSPSPSAAATLISVPMPF